MLSLFMPLLSLSASFSTLTASIKTMSSGWSPSSWTSSRGWSMASRSSMTEAVFGLWSSESLRKSWASGLKDRSESGRDFHDGKERRTTTELGAFQRKCRKHVIDFRESRNETKTEQKRRKEERFGVWLQFKLTQNKGQSKSSCSKCCNHKTLLIFFTVNSNLHWHPQFVILAID